MKGSRLASVPMVVVLLAPCLLAGSWASAEDPTPLRVRLEVGRGPFHVGEGIDLAVGVTAGDQRPSLELPQLPAADLWVVETTFKPVSVSGIGRVITGSNVFVTRLRLVARRAGPLQIPPIVARIDGRTGRSEAARLTIEPVPLEGRPASFLGGVGDFAVQASATPASVPVGQPIVFAITITGPGAWGASARPALDRLSKLSTGPEIEPLAEEASHEPPARTFTWRIRPSRPGSDVLPPVVVSAFDPVTRRYVTRASRGIPFRAMSVPVLNEKALSYEPARQPGWRRGTAWIWAAGAVLILGGASGVVLLGWRRRISPRSGPSAARKFARDAAARWSAGHHLAAGSEAEADEEAMLARRFLSDLVEYARVGEGRPPGALTPGEAEDVVGRVTGRKDLAARAGMLSARCDRVLFSGRRATGVPTLLEEAGALFSALGRSASRSKGPVSGTTLRTSD